MLRSRNSTSLPKTPNSRRRRRLSVGPGRNPAVATTKMRSKHFREAIELDPRGSDAALSIGARTVGASEARRSPGRVRKDGRARSAARRSAVPVGDLCPQSRRPGRLSPLHARLRADPRRSKVRPTRLRSRRVPLHEARMIESPIRRVPSPPAAGQRSSRTERRGRRAPAPHRWRRRSGRWRIPGGINSSGSRPTASSCVFEFDGAGKYQRDRPQRAAARRRRQRMQRSSSATRWSTPCRTESSSENKAATIRKSPSSRRNTPGSCDTVPSKGFEDLTASSRLGSGPGRRRPLGRFGS